ncbi:MAG TPA: hypothetical protein VL523_03105 [Terriglobia bacterium]|nr:hypothetical protein [Terriglobia bacterium]
MLARPGRSDTGADPQGAPLPSFGLHWLWQYLEDVPRPKVLDCGALRAATVRVLLTRCGRLYRGDLISPLDRHDPALWDRSRRSPLFRTDVLLAELPDIAPASLTSIFCWQLLDLLPRDALADVLLCCYRLLEPGGVLFCLLREPRLEKGANPDWELDGLASLVRVRDGDKPFAYPALSNREIDRLIPTGSVKTFLTRSGWREVLAVK